MALHGWARSFFGRMRALAVAAVATAIVLGTTDAYARSVTVCDSGCSYTTIAAALAAVGSGNHTITVRAPYTANERPTIRASGAGAGAELTLQANTTGLPGKPDTITTGGFVVDGDWVIVKGFVVTGSTATASVDVQGSNDQILDNRISGNTNANGSEVGIRKNDATYAANVTVSGNVISNTHGWHNDWVLLQVDCVGCTISNNDLSGSDIDVLRIWGHGNRFHHNHVHDIVGSDTARESITGEPYCLSSGAHSDVVQVYADCGDTWCQTSYDNDFYDNVLENSYCQVFTLSNDGSSGIHDFHFYNNVVVDFRLQANLGIPNVQLTNNVFIDVDPRNEMAVNLTNGGGFDDTGAVIENNVFVLNYTQPPFAADSRTKHANNYVATHTQGGSTLSVLGGWSENGGVNGGDPGLVHYVGKAADTANDFHLLATSELRGKGTPIAGMTVDKDSVQWANPPSIGAYEYSTAPKDAGASDASSPPDAAGVKDSASPDAAGDKDAGVSDASPPTDAGGGRDARAAGEGSAGANGGCGCALAGQRGAAGSAAWFAIAALFELRRRRVLRRRAGRTPA